MRSNAEGRYDLQAPSGESLTGQYSFDSRTGQLRDQASQHNVGTVAWETISPEPLPRANGASSEAAACIGILDSEVITAIQQPWNEGAFFVVPARLDGTARPHERAQIESIVQYCGLATGAARAQLAVHPAVGQFLVDGARDGRNSAADLMQSSQRGGAPFSLQCANGFLKLQRTGGEAPVEAFRSHLHSLRLLVVHGVPACGLTPDLAGWSRETHTVNLVFVSALAIRRDSKEESETYFQQESAQNFLAAQYYGALRLAARGRRKTKVYLMPAGTRSSGMSLQMVAAAMSRAVEMLGPEERPLLDLQALTWRDAGGGGGGGGSERAALATALASLGKLLPEGPGSSTTGRLAKAFGPDGTALSGAGEYGPDGMRQPLRQQKPAAAPHFGAQSGEDAEDMSLPIGVDDAGRHGDGADEDGDGAAWFRAESTGPEQRQRGQRSVRAICEGVDQLWRWGLCPSRRWTNDREQCDPPGLPEEVLDFPPEDGSLYLPSRAPQQGTNVNRPVPGDQVEVLRENDAGHFDSARVGTRGLVGHVVRDDGAEQGLPTFLVELRNGDARLWYEHDWIAQDRGRPRTGDHVLVYTENTAGRFDAQRRGTRGRVGVVTRDYGPGPSAYDVALPDGRTLQYDEDWVARVGDIPRIGDVVQVMVENPTGHFDENRVGTRGHMGVVVVDDGSDLPLLVQFKDGWSMYYAESWVRKVPPERFRVFVAPVEGEVLDEINGDYVLDPLQEAEGFPVWVKGDGERSHLLHTDRKGRWALTRAPENHIVVLSRPHGGRYPQLVDQWGILRLGTFLPIDLRVQPLNLAIIPGVKLRQKQTKAACGACCEPPAGKKEQVSSAPPRQVWQAEDVDATDQSHWRIPKTRRWERLVQFGPTSGPGCSGCCALFNDTAHKTHCGRVFQGALDNAYLVEALNAISLRPKLARQLFYAWSVDFSVYAVRLFKNGTWVCIEVDDWVPVPDVQETGDTDRPFCCYSEHFPDVLWPSVVEKAYAKACTIRDSGVGSGAASTGGWEAVGGGGRVDEAMADLTGGVASSFSTQDVSPDRLFIYLYELQRSCLFVCRVNIANSKRNGIMLNPLAHHAVNRAAHHEGHGYVQIFCSHPNGVFSGGLDVMTIPHSLLSSFPERVEDGFFWLSILDFHFYFGTIFECRLVNSADVGLPGMPPPSPTQTASAGVGDRAPLLPPRRQGDKSMRGGGGPQHGGDGGDPSRGAPICFEHVFATAGTVTEHRPPEFGIVLPAVPCEVLATVEQTCARILQVGPVRDKPTAVLLKVYENIRGDVYSSELVCKSAWKPVRGAMVAFKAMRGGSFKVVAEMGYGAKCNRLIFRCYTSAPAATVSASAGLRRHLLAEPEGPSLAIPWTLVGCTEASKMARAYHATAPERDLDELAEQAANEARCCMM